MDRGAGFHMWGTEPRLRVTLQKVERGTTEFFG